MPDVNQRLRRRALLAAATLGWITWACDAPSNHVADAGAVAVPAEHGVELNQKGEPAGLEHFHRWSERISQGGQPQGETAFANLAALGFETVVSVDGARPSLEAAERHGLRYVHVPVGYDGIGAEQALQLVKAAQASVGPVYFHCHHGLHRGPAAAMLARIGVEGLSNGEAVADLAASGCSPDYRGLYETVGDFRPPGAEALARVSADLPSSVAPEGVVGIMSFIDRRWDFALASKDAGFAALARHPDVDPAHEVGMIENSLRDLAALESSGEKRARFLEFAEAARAAAADLEKALRKGDRAAATPAFQRLEQGCSACHAEFRN